MDLLKLRAISISALMLLLMFANLFIQNTSAAVPPQDRVKNPGFETVTTSVYELEGWSTWRGGHRALMGDITSDGEVDIDDLSLIGMAFGATPGSPNWNTHTNPQGPDLNGDGIVDIRDISIVGREFGKRMGVDAFCLDGSYSWYAYGTISGSLHYLLWQDVDNDVAETVKGKKVRFSFWFYPDSDGTVRARIDYEQGGLSKSAHGNWVNPIPDEWNRVEVTTFLPGDATEIQLLIESGVPAQDFAGWIDKAELRMRFAVMEATDDYPYAYHRAWKYINPYGGVTEVHVQSYAYIEDFEVTGQEVEWYCRFLDGRLWWVWSSWAGEQDYTGPGYYWVDHYEYVRSWEWQRIENYQLHLYCGAFIADTGWPPDPCPYIPWY